MFNKISQPKPAPRSRIAFSCNEKVRSKITESMVHRMMKEKTEMEMKQHYDSYVMTNIQPGAINQLGIVQREADQYRREKARTEQAQPRVQYIRETRSISRWRCETNYEIEGLEQKQERRLVKSKMTIADQTEDCTRTRMRRVKKKDREELSKSQHSLNLVNFGLNITQIKSIQTPKKEFKPRERKSMRAQHKTSILSKESKISRLSIQESSSFQDPTTVKSGSFSSKSNNCSFLQKKSFNNREVLIKKLDEALRHKKQRSKLRKQEVSEFQKKMFKMLDCLDLVLNSYHCTFSLRREQENEEQMLDCKLIGKKKRERYGYFIGVGNNSNLIRSLMRKRSWWVEVDSLAKANLVWTQLRIASVIDRLEQCKGEDWTTEVILYEEIKQDNCIRSTNCTNNSTLLRSTCKTANSTSIADMPRVKQPSLRQLFHEKQSKRYHSLLDCKQSELRLNKVHTPGLVHNHYEHNYMFGNKNALYYNLSKYYEFMKKDISQVVPLTAYLEKGNRKAMLDFEKIFAQFKDKHCIWILKPAQNSNRGKGIEVSNSLPFIKSKLNTEKKLIVQHYIKHLLLYNYRKFDIRTYMIGVTINGRHKFYFYEEGYLRTSSQFYDSLNLRDQFIHLTNDAIQKKGDNYGKYEEGNKLSYPEFQRYLDTRFKGENWQMVGLHEKMKQMAGEAVRATYSRIDLERKKCSFELFGLDFIVDSHFRPYLIEINTNPCLELCSAVLERLLPRMMENMFRLCVDPVFRPNANHSYSKSQSYYLYDQTFLDRNRFSLIFDEKYDKNYEWEERCQKMRGLEWSNETEEEFADEGSLIQVDY